jgi:hypothetical protein
MVSEAIILEASFASCLNITENNMVKAAQGAAFCIVVLMKRLLSGLIMLKRQIIIAGTAIRRSIEVINTVLSNISLNLILAI